MWFKDKIIKIKEYIKRPLFIILILAICFSLSFFLFGQLIVQNFYTMAFIVGILLILLMTILFYREYKRPLDVLAFPLFASISLLFYTIILFILFYAFHQLYLSSIEPELNHISFPLALFALGVSLFYFVVGQFSTENKLDQILYKLNKIEIDSESDPAINTDDLVQPILYKNYSSISDEDKIMFEHLFDRHKNILSYVDTLDNKVAQILALNGLILSITIFTVNNAKTIELFFLGMIIIIISILSGIRCYMGQDYFIGASVKFFTDYDTFPNGLGIQKLKKQLLLDIKRNEKSYNMKTILFKRTIYIMIIGLIFILVGYYA